MTDRIRVIEHTPPVDEPFYGYRYRTEVDPDGVETIHILPLTYEDLKYPEEGDEVMHNIRHTQLFVLLSSVCLARLADDPERFMTGDLRLDLGLADGGAVGPDIAIVRGVQPPGSTATLRVPGMADEVELIIEITSPSTRSLDLGFRLERFHEARIKRVIIIDAANPDSTAVLGIQVLDWTSDGYVAVPLDPPNQVWVWQLRLWLGVEDDDLVLRDEDRAVVGDYAAEYRQLLDEQRHAAALAQAAELERQRAALAQHEAESERQRADAAEAAYRALVARARALGMSLNGR